MRLEGVLKLCYQEHVNLIIRLKNVLKMSWRRFQNLLKTSWRRLEGVLKMSWSRFQNILKTSLRCLEIVLKTSWKRLEDVLKTYDQDKYVGLDEDVLKTSSEDVWVRRKYSSWSRRLEDVFIKTNICWDTTPLLLNDISSMLVSVSSKHRGRKLFYKQFFASILSIYSLKKFSCKLILVLFWLRCFEGM